MRRNWKALAAGALAFAALQCSNFSPVAGTGGSGSEVEAKLAYRSGQSAKNARVYLLPAAFLTSSSTILPVREGFMAIIDSTRSDGTGAFRFDSLEAGAYVIEAYDDSSNAVRYAGLVLDGRGGVTKLGTLILAPTGAIRGVVRLSEGGDPQKVLVIASGGDRLAFPDNAGVFTFDSLAQGSYNLRLLPLLDYAVLDTAGVNVVSGHVTDVGILLPRYTGIPSPRDLSLAYDSMRQFVTISWTGVNSLAVGGYNIYRAPSGGYNFLRITNPYVARTRTTFIDTTAGQDTLYQYRVTSLDTTLQFESVWAGAASDTVRITSVCTLAAAHALEQNGEMTALTVLPGGSFAVAQNGGMPLIYVYNPDASLLASWLPGEPGPLQDMFLASDDSGSIYVVNYLDEKYVAVFGCTAAGAVRQQWVTGLPYSSINGIAVHGTNLFVNTRGDLIHVFNAADMSVTPGRTFIQKPGDSRSSRGIAVSASGDALFTARSSLVFAFDTARTPENAALVSQWNAREAGRLAVRSDGSVVIVNRETMQACIYSTDGQFIARFSLKENCVDISDIDFGPQGYMYVLAKNARTLLWELRIYAIGI